MSFLNLLLETYRKVNSVILYVLSIRSQPWCYLSGFSHYQEMSTIWIDVHYLNEREGGNSEVEPLVVKTDLNMKFLIIFRIFFTLFLFFIFNWGEGRKNKIKT